jgi:hypothetical protein
MLNSLNIEPNGWNSSYELVQLQAIEHSCFTAPIIAKDHNALLLGFEDVEVSETTNKIAHGRRQMYRMMIAITSTFTMAKSYIHTRCLANPLRTACTLTGKLKPAGFPENEWRSSRRAMQTVHDS